VLVRKLCVGAVESFYYKSSFLAWNEYIMLNVLGGGGEALMGRKIVCVRAEKSCRFLTRTHENTICATYALSNKNSPPKRSEHKKKKVSSIVFG
jgi:hypothetical protein